MDDLTRDFMGYFLALFGWLHLSIACDIRNVVTSFSTTNCRWRSFVTRMFSCDYWLDNRPPKPLYIQFN